jgi:hypothetical protein
MKKQILKKAAQDAKFRKALITKIAAQRPLLQKKTRFDPSLAQRIMNLIQQGIIDPILDPDLDDFGDPIPFDFQDRENKALMASLGRSFGDSYGNLESRLDELGRSEEILYNDMTEVLEDFESQRILFRPFLKAAEAAMSQYE